MGAIMEEMSMVPLNKKLSSIATRAECLVKNNNMEIDYQKMQGKFLFIRKAFPKKPSQITTKGVDQLVPILPSDLDDDDLSRFFNCVTNAHRCMIECYPREDVPVSPESMY